jgi:hypothetical protein
MYKMKKKKKWKKEKHPKKGGKSQLSVGHARIHRRIFFRNQPIRKKNVLWRPCL